MTKQIQQDGCFNQLINLQSPPIEIATSLQHLPNLLFFDTSGNIPSSNSHPISIITARPTEVIDGNIHTPNDAKYLQDRIDHYTASVTSSIHPPQTTHLPFPQGGACGWIDYDGSFCFGIYTEMLIYDHVNCSWWEYGNLSKEISTNQTNTSSSPPRFQDFDSSMSREVFEEGVRRIHDYIAAGDIYQVNLTQRFSANITGGSLFPLYQQLRKSTPSPMGAWMQLGKREILSSSPESFLHISQRQIKTQPIKGTRPRGNTPTEDQALANELIHCPKELAELTMITDLERNDLGQVCSFGSVHVPKMLVLEPLEHVFHLVSTVEGTLKENISHLQALSACFPGGSITGAPKKRAMEIIEELEPVPRGLYTGAIGYLGFNGESQFNIPIRTLIREKGKLHYHVGAGIVADSSPSAEFQETLDKAKGIRLAIQAFSTRNKDV